MSTRILLKNTAISGAERLAWNVFAGMGMIFIGIIGIDGRLIKKFRRKKVWCYEI
jgi:hypothetical protein